MGICGQLLAKSLWQESTSAQYKTDEVYDEALEENTENAVKFQAVSVFLGIYD